jgi:GNAT superfamily N-acetyltransferase
MDGAPPGGSPHPLLGSVGRAVRPVSRGTLDDSTVVDTAAIIRQRMVRPMPSRQQAPQGRMSSGGTPASASALLGRTNQALRAAGDPVAEVSLRDGLTVYLRPVRAEDAAAIRRLFQGLSETSTWLRFFSTCPSLDRVVDWATKVDNGRRLGVVAIAADSGQLIAHAGLECDHRQPDRAEFAVAVADPYQGRGLGRILLGRLVEAARQTGIRWLTGEVLANNHRMLHLLRHSGWAVRLRLRCGVVLVELPTWSSPDSGMIPAA